MVAVELRCKQGCDARRTTRTNSCKCHYTLIDVTLESGFSFVSGSRYTAMTANINMPNQTVHIYRDKPLGKGSYGSVYRAQCDELPCAAKILHPVFFQFNDPASQVLLKKFEQECEVMRTMIHPHIVQYLGTYRDPETGLPVLLMELMDGSLTKFLEQSKDLPFHVQVNLCHDIALALAYLHSNGVIHRDLSSNNVLLIAGSRAKVTDFGMSKLIESNPRMTPLTQCPGTEVYMSPEALRTPPIYTKKLDTFSFGVLSVQIMTCKFPNPGPARNTIEDLRYPTGKVEVPVPEVERREEHIAMVNPRSSLLAVALQGLSDEEKSRPTAHILCEQLAAMKESSQYKLSLDLPDVHSRESDGNAPSELTKMVRELHLQQEANKRELVKRDAEIKHLKAAGNQKSNEGMEEKVCELTQKLKEKEEEIEMLRRKLSSQEGYQHSQSDHLETTLELSWKRLRNAPSEMSGGASTIHEDTVYFNPFNSQKVLAYTLDEGRWSSNAVPECPLQNSHLIVVNGLLTAVGGQYEGEITNSLLSLVDGHHDGKWVEKFPPFPSKRMSVSVVCYMHYLVVAGGKLQMLSNEYKVTTVEVMNVNTMQWYNAASLPYPACSMGASVCGDQLYLAGGFEVDGDTKKVLHCSLPALTQSCQPLSNSLGARIKRAISSPQGRDHHIWQNVADVTVDHPKLVTVSGELVAVGCRGSGLLTTTVVCVYKPRVGYWKTVSTVPTARDWSFVVAPTDDKFQLMVVGGYVQSISGSSCTDIVEVASVL